MAEKKKFGSKKKVEKKPEKKEAPKKEEAPKADPPKADPPKVTKPPKADSPKEESPPKKKEEKKSVVSGWYDKLLDAASGKMKDIPAPLQKAGGKAIDYFKEHKDEFIDLGEEGFGTLVGFLSNGERGKAKDFYIKTKLGPEDLIAAMKKSTAAMKKGVEKRNQLEEIANRFIKTLTALGCNVLKGLIFA